MVYRGHVRNGKIELDGDVKLPEGSSVEISVPSPPCAPVGDSGEGPSLYERLKDFVGVIDDLPPDASVNVDHYLYGLPKR